MMAITREVSESLAECEVTWVERQPIDVGRARLQHDAYITVLESRGFDVVRLPALDDLPDAVFVEDPIHVLDEVAIALRPGAPSRQPEVEPLADAVGRYRPVVRLEAPATADGGDILRIDRTLYVGRSTRTNEIGIRELVLITSRYGYSVVPVDMRDCLHLKSGCTSIGGRVLINPDWIDAGPFAELDPLPVPADEPWAADVLLLADTIVMPDSFPATAALLRSLGREVVTVDVSEFQKAEAGVTCLSVVFR